MTSRLFHCLWVSFLPVAGLAMDRDVVVMLVPREATGLVLEVLGAEKTGLKDETIPWVRWNGAFTTNIDPHAALAILLSGETSQNNGVLDFRGSLYPEKCWLPEAFVSSGYRVAILSDSPVLRSIREDAVSNDHPALLESDVEQGSVWLKGSLAEGRPLLFFWDGLNVDDPLRTCIAMQRTLKTLMSDHDCRARLQRARWLVVGMGAPADGEQVHLLLGHWGPVAAGVADAWVELLDVAPSLVRRLGVTIPSFIRGIDLQAVIEGRHPGHEAVHFRWWNHLGDGVTPAHVGVRTKEQRLVFYYGVDYQEREGMVEDEESFLALMAETQTAPYWVWACAASKQSRVQPGCSGFDFDPPRELKGQLLEMRRTLGETDRNYPHIENIWDQEE
jgi:hypothetical protein